MNETWADEVKAVRAEGCENLSDVGAWKIIKMRATDSTSYSHNLSLHRERGLIWCVRASSLFHSEPKPQNGDNLWWDTKFVCVRATDSSAFSFELSRLTEPLQVVDEAFEGADGAKFRKNQQIVCVQYMERTPSGNPHMFVLSQTEVYVDIKSVFYSGFDPKNKVREHDTDTFVSVIIDDHELKTIQNRLSEFLFD